MRYSIIAVAPFVAAAYAQSSETESASPTVVPVVSGDTTISSTYTYSNTMTNFLSLTNSDGVVTGMPTLSNGAVATAAVTSQPDVATVPAGLSGINTVYIGNGSSLSSFIVSAGTSTTVVVGGDVQTGATVVSGSASVATGTGSGSSASSTGSSNSDNDNDNNSSASGSSDEATATSDNGPSSTESSASETSSSAADSIKLASGAVFGLGALFAALL